MSSLRMGANGDQYARLGLCLGEVLSLGEVKACGYLPETQGGGALERHGKIVLDMEERSYIRLAAQEGFVLKVELQLILEG